jgi:hypothetical protein
MLLLFTCMLMAGANEIPGLTDPLLASESDYGLLTLRNATTAGGVAGDANIYFVDDFEMTNKIHVIIGVTDCLCVGFGDSEKINQLDYLAIKRYMYSFGMYISYNLPYRARCGLQPAQIQQRTSLYWNGVGSNTAVTGVHTSPWWPIPLHKPADDWVEGPLMYAGMRDFRQHSYVTSNQAAVYDNDKSGGILYMQGTVFMRPCLLWPWYTPWLLDGYGTDGFTINLLPPFTITPYFNGTDAELFYETTATLKEKGVITDKHIANLKDNNGNSANRAHVFHFQAVFIPHRFVGEFMTLLEGYKDTTLSPSVYVPFIFQLMWDKNSWSRLTQHNNNTLYASYQPVLNSCLGDTVQFTMENINTDLVQQLSYFAYGWCGWPSPISDISYIIKEEIKYITTTGQKYLLYHLYEVVFWLVVAMCGICLLWCVRRRVYDCYLKCKLKFPHLRGYSKMNVPHSYIPKTRDATYAMSEFSRDGAGNSSDPDFDDDDEDDKKGSIKAAGMHV